MIPFLAAFLLFWGGNVVLCKYNLYLQIHNFSNFLARKKLSRLGFFFFKMSKCEFCVEHHIALIPTLMICAYFNEWGAGMIAFPFLIASLSNFFKTISAK